MKDVTANDDRFFWPLIAGARQRLGVAEPSEANIHAAAVGLAAHLYRNTDAVEHDAHAAGPWTDADMLRNNARATEICRRALLAARDSGPGELDDIFTGMLDQLAALLPTSTAQAKLRREQRTAAARWAELIRREGLPALLAVATVPSSYPARWWGAPDWQAIVQAYCTLDEPPPGAESFHDRMLRAPWELDDEQAGFVLRHRVDIARST